MKEKANTIFDKTQISIPQKVDDNYLTSKTDENEPLNSTPDLAIIKFNRQEKDDIFALIDGKKVENIKNLIKLGIYIKTNRHNVIAPPWLRRRDYIMSNIQVFFLALIVYCLPTNTKP